MLDLPTKVYQRAVQENPEIAKRMKTIKEDIV